MRLPESTTAGEKEESLPGREGPLRPDFRGKMRTQGTAGRGICGTEEREAMMGRWFRPAGGEGKDSPTGLTRLPTFLCLSLG